LDTEFACRERGKKEREKRKNGVIENTTYIRKRKSNKTKPEEKRRVKCLG